MKLCGLKLKIFFICLPFLALGFLSVAHGANAAITFNTYYDLGTSNRGTTAGSGATYHRYQDITIPSGCDNSVLIELSTNVGSEWSTGTFAGETMTIQATSTVPNNRIITILTIADPLVGTHTLDNGLGYLSTPLNPEIATRQLFLYCGANQDDALSNIKIISSSLSSGTVESPTGTDLTFFTSWMNTAGYSQTINIPSGFTDRGLSGEWSAQYRNAELVSDSPISNFAWTGPNTTGALIYFTILEAGGPYSIQYTGIGTEQANKNGDFFIPFYWDVCDNYGEVVAVDMWAYFDNITAGVPFTLIDPNLIGPQQCRGTRIYTTNADYSSDLNATGTFKLYLEVDTTSGIEYAETISSHYYALYTEPSTYLFGSGMGFDSSFNQLVNTSTGTSTEVQAMYDFTGLNDWASSTICVYNIQAGVDTDYCFIPTTESGFASVYLPYSPSNEFDLYFKWHATFPTSAEMWDNDHTFHMIWQVFSNINTVDPLICQPPIFNLTNICIDDNTGEELGKISCALKTAFVYTASALFDPSCDSFQSINNNYTDFKESFPFNVYFELADTMTAAIDIATSSTSTTAVFRVPLIKKTATSTEYYMASGISSTSVSNTIGTSNYSVFYSTVGFVYWILLAFVSYLVLRKI